MKKGTQLSHHYRSKLYHFAQENFREPRYFMNSVALSYSSLLHIPGNDNVVLKIKLVLDFRFCSKTIQTNWKVDKTSFVIYVNSLRKLRARKCRDESFSRIGI